MLCDGWVHGCMDGFSVCVYYIIYNNVADWVLPMSTERLAFVMLFKQPRRLTQPGRCPLMRRVGGPEGGTGQHGRRCRRRRR